MQSIFVFLDITKFADFWWKNADVSRTQGVCQVIYIIFWIFFRSGITVPSIIYVGYVWQILGKGDLSPPPPSLSSPENAHPE